jgi:hypothetical protein
MVGPSPGLIPFKQFAFAISADPVTENLGFSTRLFARDSVGPFFRILAALSVVASIFHRFSVSVLCSEALLTLFRTTIAAFVAKA